MFDSAILEFAKQLNPDITHEDWNFLGKKLSDEIAVSVAEGEINPITFKDYDKNCLENLTYKETFAGHVNQQPKNTKTNKTEMRNQSKLTTFMKPMTEGDQNKQL